MKKFRRFRLFALLPALVLMTAAFFASGGAAAPAQAPNVIVILADDIGYTDLGCYGSEIETPKLDALAKNGIRFTQFYNTARCCPTRAALLTGLYPHQAGVGHMMADKQLDGYRGDLNRRSLTIAEVLRPAGYRTYMAGKWHLTKAVEPVDESEKHNWPLQRGFDRFYGTIRGAGSFFDPASLTRDNTFVSPFADPGYRPDEYYYTDAISDHAVTFLRDHARDQPDKPFFLYVAYTAPHWPMHAKEKDIAKYKGRYDAGYDAIRAARLERARTLGVIDARWEMAPQKGGVWADVKDREFELRCMEVFAAMVDTMDQGIGRIVAELERQGQLDRTLILYMQDNGACAETMGRNAQTPATLRPVHPTLPPLAATDLRTDSPPKQTRDGFPVRQGYGVLPGPADTYVAYGEAWANVSNTPFREYKHWVHEGGISSPLIAHWPAGIPAARRNTLEAQPAHLIDIMATCVDLARAPYPEKKDGESIHPLEGVSLRPAFAGQPLGREEPIFFEHEGNRAVRDGRWKLVAKGPAGAWELYDMQTDRTELHDLAARDPQRVQAMAKQWETWAHRANVLPWIWKPAYGAAPASAHAKGKGKGRS